MIISKFVPYGETGFEIYSYFEKKYYRSSAIKLIKQITSFSDLEETQVKMFIGMMFSNKLFSQRVEDVQNNTQILEMIENGIFKKIYKVLNDEFFENLQKPAELLAV